MALHFASSPRFLLRSFPSTNAGLLAANPHHPRSSGFTTKTQTRSQIKTRIVTCSIQPTSLDSAHATRYLETLSVHILQGFSAAASTHAQDLLIADLDPVTAKTAIAILGPLLSAFSFLFIIRIVMSWYPKIPVGKLPYVVAYAPTEPLLRVTRKVIPPLGGVDVTPVVWFGLVSFLNEILVGPQGLLVLLSQQIQSG